MAIKNSSYRLVLNDKTLSITILPEVQKLQETRNLLQTKRRVASIFRAMNNQGILNKISNNEKTLIVFEYGSHYLLNAGMTILVSQSSPKKYSIEITAIKNLSDELFAQIKESKNNNTSKTPIFFIEEFTLPYFMIKSSWDYSICTLKPGEKSASFYLSKIVAFKNSSFLERYSFEPFAFALYLKLEQNNLIDNYIDNKMIYLEAIDEADQKKCLLELSIVNTGADGTTDSIDVLVNNFSKSEYSELKEKLQLAKEVIYDMELTLKRTPVKKKKPSTSGLKIVKKKNIEKV